MNGPIRRLALAIFVGLALLLANVTYIQLARGPEYRDDPRNPRVLLARSSKERGTIVDRSGKILARSVQDPLAQGGFIRRYPQGADTVHAVGYSSLLFGDRGLERAYASELRSKEDVTISDMVAALLGRDLRPQSLVSTIDLDIQRIATEQMDGVEGAIVALDPATGEIVAYVSHPDFDPAPLLDATSAPAGDALEADPDQPLLDRVVAETYPPGSTFKIVTLAAALENGVASPETLFDDPVEFDLPGSTATIRNFDRSTCAGGGEVELAVAFTRSCNTVFADLGIQVGADRMVQQAEAFGFGDPVPFIYDVVASTIPSADNFTNNEAALGQSAIGQRDVRATPLQMAQVAAAIANGGVPMQPQLVREIVDADGATINTTEPVPGPRAVSEDTASTLTELMIDVVENGTGRNASVAGLTVAGKTGTAETETGPPHAWFVGFANDGARILAIAVVVADGGSLGDEATGGSVAAPIARAIFEGWSQQ
jgi:peptidoglycan glycosyltransferase